MVAILFFMFLTIGSIWFLCKVPYKECSIKNALFLSSIFIVGFIEVHLQNTFLLKGNVLGKKFISIILVGMAIASVTPNVIVL